ncbi:MAG: BrnT family toxin, partial [Dehalococcoidales bacterium]|nr:BrnT family toxin [Dehalococcoidales bacterium]
DEHILDKIESKHGITFQEAEEACLSGARHIRKSRDELYKVFSQTNAGRYILVVLVNRNEGVWKIVTARDMTDSERQLYNRR